MDLLEVTKQFPTQEVCIKHLENLRWSGTPVCPYCSATQASSRKGTFRHHCNGCNTSFSVLVGTIFEDTKLEIQKWFMASILTSLAIKMALSKAK